MMHFVIVLFILGMLLAWFLGIFSWFVAFGLGQIITFFAVIARQDEIQQNVRGRSQHSNWLSKNASIAVYALIASVGVIGGWFIGGQAWVVAFVMGSLVGFVTALHEQKKQ